MRSSASKLKKINNSFLRIFVNKNKKFFLFLFFFNFLFYFRPVSGHKNQKIMKKKLLKYYLKKKHKIGFHPMGGQRMKSSFLISSFCAGNDAWRRFSAHFSVRKVGGRKMTFSKKKWKMNFLNIFLKIVKIFVHAIFLLIPT